MPKNDRIDVTDVRILPCLVEEPRATTIARAVSFPLQPHDNSHSDALHEILSRLRKARECGDWSQAVLLDLTPHRQLYVLCGQRRLLRTWDDLGLPLLHIFRLSRHPYDDTQDVHAITRACWRRSKAVMRRPPTGRFVPTSPNSSRDCRI